MFNGKHKLNLVLLYWQDLSKDINSQQLKKNLPENISQIKRSQTTTLIHMSDLEIDPSLQKSIRNTPAFTV